jgi:hypothetical protein
MSQPKLSYDRLKYESDETLPDGWVVARGAPLPNKIWRVRNVGDSSWRGYTLTFFRGERFGAPLSVPLPELMPNESGLVVLPNLRAPDLAGLFIGEWRPCRPDGTTFPAYLSVVIKVE